MRRVLACLAILAALSIAAPVVRAHDVDCSALPIDGPGGVDLRAACTLDEVTGAYTHTHPVTFFDPALGMLALFGGIAVVGIGALGWRLVGRRIERRMGPTTPSEWWQCGACGSLNQPNRGVCYSCRRPYDSTAMAVPTAAGLD